MIVHFGKWCPSMFSISRHQEMFDSPWRQIKQGSTPGLKWSVLGAPTSSNLVKEKKKKIWQRLYGVDGSKTSYLPTPKRVQHTNFRCFGKHRWSDHCTALWKECEIWGQRVLGQFCQRHTVWPWVSHYTSLNMSLHLKLRIRKFSRWQGGNTISIHETVPGFDPLPCSVG